MPPRPKKTERRQQLIDAAMTAFGAKGYHGTQVADIIKEAGVARGTFYLYFDSKRDIFDAVVQSIYRRVQEVIRPINKEDFTKVPGEILGNIERATTLLIENPMLIKIFFSDAVGLDEEFDAKLREYYEIILGKIRGGLVHGQRMGIIREGDVNILSLCLMGSLKELLYQYFLEPIARNSRKSSKRFIVSSSTRP